MNIIPFSEFKQRYDVNFKAKKGDADFIGQGGFGAVYKGHDLVRHFDVAIKRSPTDKELLDEFERGRALPIHPNIVRYIDGFRVETDADDFDVAILQFYPHGNLDQLIAKQKLSEKQLDDVLKGILRGLQFMHEGFKDEKGQIVKIIHRDLKPQNILISEHNGKFSALITDFGISRTVNEDDQLSTGGGIGNSSDTGTIVYKAPEQIKGHSIRTNLDLWAFGVMLFKILKGRLPFYSDASPTTDAFKMDVMNKITSTDLNSIFEQLKEQPQKYQDIIKACLVRDNKDRVQSARELIEIFDAEATSKATISSTYEEKTSVGKVNTDIKINQPQEDDLKTDVVARPQVNAKKEESEKPNNTGKPIEQEVPKANNYLKIFLGISVFLIACFVVYTLMDIPDEQTIKPVGIEPPTTADTSNTISSETGQVADKPQNKEDENSIYESLKLDDKTTKIKDDPNNPTDLLESLILEDDKSFALKNGTKLNTGPKSFEYKLVQSIEDQNVKASDNVWFVMNSVRFKTAKGDLDASNGASSSQIFNLSLILKAYPNVKIFIASHSDNTGDENSNLSLTKERAKAVGDALESLGISSSRITTEGYGSEEPKASNATAEGRARNKRIEVGVLRK